MLMNWELSVATYFAGNRKGVKHRGTELAERAVERNVLRALCVSVFENSSLAYDCDPVSIQIRVAARVLP